MSNDSNNFDDDGSGDDFAPVVGGLFSGGQLNERNGDPVRVGTGGPATGSITARTPDGFAINDMSELRPDSIIKLPNGLETDYASALTAGLVKPLTGQQGQEQQQQRQDETQQQQQQQQDQQSNTGNPRLDDQSEAWLGESLDNSTEATVFAATDVINKDGITQDAVENIAAANNIAPEEARQRIEHVAAAMENEAYVETAKTLGTSVDIARAAIQAARTERPSELREAATKHFHSGKPAYEKFVRDHMAQLDQTDPNRILQANPIPGRKVHYSGEHRCVVVTDTTTGKTYRWQDAVYLGLIGIK